MKIADILRTKGSAVVTIAPDRTVQDALQMLVDHNIGALVVLDGRIQGIVSERDLLRIAAADVRHLDSARVRDVMTTEVIVTAPDADIQQVMDVMTERRIRHLPVLSGGAVCGIVSIGDVVNALRQHVETENRHLHAYIAGTPL